MFVYATKNYDEEVFSAGYKLAEELVTRYLEGGYDYDSMLHALAYSAAAQLFRDMPREEAMGRVSETFDCILRDLLRYGPHYGDEPY
jgi:hypothetical protein